MVKRSRSARLARRRPSCQVRGETLDQTLIAILKRMTLVESDAAKYSKRLQDSKKPEVVYLDPMFYALRMPK